VTDRESRNRIEMDASRPAAEAGEKPRRRRPAIDFGVLDSHLGYLVRRLQLWIFQDFTRTLAKFDIRPAQYSVLVLIEANTGLSQADVAEALGIERARLVRVLDELEKRDLIRRLASPNDRRSHALVLTREGQRRLKPIKALAAAHEAKVDALLGEEHRDALLAALRNFGAADDPPQQSSSEHLAHGAAPRP
jgi:DNA-binding MarR family transcriptional regulator